MGLVAKYNIDALIAGVESKINTMTDNIVDALYIACTETVREARMLPSPNPAMRALPHQPNYIDDTGYLRGSVGFAIYKNGQSVMEDFNSPMSSGGSGAGTQRGQNAAKIVSEEISRKYSNGIVAVVVAGAEYAATLESKGYDVISGSTIGLKQTFEKYIKQAFMQYERK